MKAPYDFRRLRSWELALAIFAIRNYALDEKALIDEPKPVIV